MVNRERIKVSQYIDTIHYNLDGTIDRAILFLQKMKEEYPDAFINYEEDVSSYDSRYVMALKIMVDETDEQYAERIDKEERYEYLREEHDRKQYEALKAKFGE